MYELRTTTLNALDHPELVLAFDDAAFAAQGEYWIERLPSWIERGNRYEVGQIPNLDGWPVVPVQRDDGSLQLHARVLENYRDGKTIVSLDGHARFAQEQRRFAQRYGDFDPPHWLASVLVCPRWQRYASVLTREASDGYASGWVIQCDDTHCRDCAKDARHHCPQDEWVTLDIAELAVARPGLVQLLGLPAGHRIQYPFGNLLDQVVERFELAYGHDIARMAGFVSGRLLTDAKEMSGDADAAIDLDFERESVVYEETYDTLVMPALRERYGLSKAAAKATLARAWSRESLLAYVRWKYREKLTNELCDVVEAALAIDVGSDDRWKVTNDAARKLVPLTNQAFITWKPIVEGYDKLLQRANKMRNRR